MIITTLAARGYQGESDIYSALCGLLQRIDTYRETQLISTANGRWYIGNPVNHEENFADRWNDSGSKRADAFFQWIRWVREDLMHAIEAGTVKGIVDALAEGFDRQQLEKIAEGIQPGGSIISAAEASVPMLADTRHKQAPPWAVDLRYKVKVKGTVHKAIGQPKVLWQLTGRPLPKGVGLRFRADTNVPLPYEVKWQVVNTGKEAMSDSGLRGDFDDGFDVYGATKWGHTAYRGTHWIEAFVVKNGACVARSGPTYVKIR